MIPVPEGGMWEPGLITVLDERLTDVAAFERRQEQQREVWLGLVALVERGVL